jgi:hypothetical protein
MRVNIGIVTRLRPGRMRDRSLIPDRVKIFIFSSKCQDYCVGHLASCSMGTGSFLPRSKDSGASTYRPRVPKLRLNAVTSTPHAFMAHKGTQLHLHLPSA